MKRILIALIVPLLACSCAILNPYKDDFECPVADKGKCVSIERAYKESNERKDPAATQGLVKDKKVEKAKQEAPVVSDATKAEDAWRKEVYSTLQELLKDPKTPIVTPPKVMRLLILPYQNGKHSELYLPRYIYFIVDEPRFIMGDKVTWEE